ncbi:MAG: EAL domain-containing protein, partial [Candidatus Eremiobacterota bacterium]
QFHMASGRLVGFEALARWQHPERGLLGPAQFIAVAEEAGLIGDLGGWVLDEAIRQLAEWDVAGIHVPRMAVNVSIVQFLAQSLPALVRQILDRHNVEPRRLELEITETVLVRDHKGVIKQMRELAELGVKFALDDFGTGYSSLAYLQEYPVHTLKIAQEFVPENPRSEAIVGTVASMARALGLGLVAEGVETQRHAELLAEVGCTVGQGFLFSRAVPSEEAAEIARTHL